MKKALFSFIVMALALPNLSLAVYDDNDDSCDESSLITPVVSATVNDGSITLSWEEIVHDNLKGYKVVISDDDSTPVYPANGYLRWITNTSITSHEIDNSSAYRNGDFGSYLEEGEDYYFSVTAVYDCDKVAGNVLELTYPGDSTGNNDYPGYVWTLDEDSYTPNDKAYMTVAPQSHTDPHKIKIYGMVTPAGEDYEKFLIKSGVTVSDGSVVALDLDGFEVDDDREYQYSILICSAITGCTEGHTNAGPINITQDDDDDDTSHVAPPTPVVSVSSSDDGVLVSWEKITDDRFNGYKVVASKNNSKPKYPSGGYLRYITNRHTTSYLIDNSSKYRNGDFGKYFKAGEEYYFSITALYDTGKVAGNAVTATYNGPEHDEKPDPKPDVDPLVDMRDKAKKLRNSELDDILAELQQLRNQIKEQENELKYLRSLVHDLSTIAQKVRDSLNQFITYGVDENTQKLGEGERAAVIHSFKSAFGKLPETDDELADAIKIANGRWPSKTNEAAENRAKVEFKRIYLRDANMSNPNDNAAVTVMAYGLRQKAENRNLDSERQGINTFKYIYGHTPGTTDEWNIMQAITYSGASR